MLVSPSVSFMAYANLRCSNFSAEEGMFLAIPSDKTFLRTKLSRVATVLTRFSAGIKVWNYSSKLNEKCVFFSKHELTCDWITKAFYTNPIRLSLLRAHCNTHCSHNLLVTPRCVPLAVWNFLVHQFIQKQLSQLSQIWNMLMRWAV